MQVKRYVIFHSMLTRVLLSSKIDPCKSTGDVRLPDENKSVGRLLVCYNGYWGSVLEGDTGNEVADVACRQLGYEKGQMRFTCSKT